MAEALLREKIQAVKEELAASSAHLDKLLGEIEDAPRAEKIGVSAVVRDAFDRLIAARAHLEELEILLAKKPCS
jgi:hypothetical protein